MLSEREDFWGISRRKEEELKWRRKIRKERKRKRGERNHLQYKPQAFIYVFSVYKITRVPEILDNYCRLD